jgi:pyruvate dehydrogenase complex dehydrogenase (E1) component
MAFVRILTTLVRDKTLGKYVVPIVPDESRTFGMEGMFRQLGILSQVGQLYKPQDADQLMFYAKTVTVRFCKKASTKLVRCRRGSLPRRRTARMASR